ncbi:putative beta-carotene-binding protein [Diprion similis]|uniref:putative beta-carotene-binding protein n=1 Tax=Diprion similis TaxID=362088 RepID=UPI001EF7DFCC|nr:putative beta-carotene-binding protein [Diprion similis]
MMLRFVLFTLFAGYALAAVPSYMKVCGRRNPKMDECVVNSAESLKEMLGKGIKELDVPPLEPLLLAIIKLADDNSLRAIATNVKLYNLSNFKCNFLHVDLEKHTIDMQLTFPQIKLEAEYNVTTRIVNVPINGIGPMKIITDAVGAKVNMKFRLVQHKGAEYLIFSSMTTNLDIKDYTSHFTPREGPDGALAEGINAALQDNRQEIIATIKPNLEQVISERVLQLANRICKHFTFDELFPDRE